MVVLRSNVGTFDCKALDVHGWGRQAELPHSLRRRFHAAAKMRWSSVSGRLRRKCAH